MSVLYHLNLRYTKYYNSYCFQTGSFISDTANQIICGVKEGGGLNAGFKTDSMSLTKNSYIHIFRLYL